MLRAGSESGAYAWKKFDSRNRSNPSVFFWTYNRAPATMTVPSFAGAVSYQAAGDSAPVLYTSDTTPMVSGAVSDPEGNTVQGNFYLDAPKFTPVTSCLSGSVASGAKASCTGPTIPKGTTGWVRAQANDSNGQYGGWSPLVRFVASSLNHDVGEPGPRQVGRSEGASAGCRHGAPVLVQDRVRVHIRGALDRPSHSALPDTNPPS